MGLSNDTIKEKLSEKLGEAIVNFEEPYGMLSFEVKSDQNLKVLNLLHDEMGFTFLTDITAVHFPDRIGEELSVVYHLHNLVENVRIRVYGYRGIFLGQLDGAGDV